MEDPYFEDSTASYRRSSTFDHPDGELILRGSAAKKGKCRCIAMGVGPITNTLERCSLDPRLAVLGLENPGMIEYMVDTTSK